MKIDITATYVKAGVAGSDKGLARMRSERSRNVDNFLFIRKRENRVIRAMATINRRRDTIFICPLRQADRKSRFFFNIKSLKATYVNVYLGLARARARAERAVLTRSSDDQR